MRLLRALRQLIAPAGKHRTPPGTTVVPHAVLLRPTEAMVTDLGWCPTELRQTLHAYLRTGGRICWSCRTKTEGQGLNPVTDGGGAV